MEGSFVQVSYCSLVALKSYREMRGRGTCLGLILVSSAGLRAGAGSREPPGWYGLGGTPAPE